MTINYNPLTDVDSYKYSHFKQYPPGTTMINSYIESRGGVYNTVFFGLQAFLIEYLSKPFTRENLEEAADLIPGHGLPFNYEGFEYILNHHEGYWPIRIEALKEGLVTRPLNCLVQINNTDPNVPWVTSFLETALVRAVWYPTTVASRSRFIKNIIKKYLEKTADSLDGLPFKLHDFGARGVSSRESSYLGGMAHLVNFMGTDTVEALRAAKQYYNSGIAGFSIPAAEHSTITAWTRTREADAYKNMIHKFGGSGKLVAVVSDSYDIYNACSNIWPSLKNEIISVGGTVVIRPDSGIPEEVITTLLEILSEKFGYSINSKGYKMLPDNIRIIQGDGINEVSVENILKKLTDAGFSSDNVAFGMGGELLQTPNRDTMKFAMKASAAVIGSEMIGISKNPIGDSSKRSKEGILKVIETPDGIVTVDHKFPGNNLLEKVFENGKILRNQTFDEIRGLAAL